MPLDIEAARRLHDRGENNPAHCDTCTDPAGTHPVYWPCPTAVALGATGRSEWDDAAATGGTCACGHARGTHKHDTHCRNCDCHIYDEYTP